MTILSSSLLNVFAVTCMIVKDADGDNTLLAFIAFFLGITAPVALWFFGSEIEAKASSLVTSASGSRDNLRSRNPGS
jgi:hypothetical protein